MPNDKQNETKRRPMFKTQRGASVLAKMLKGGTPEQIRARMTPEDLETLKEMKASVSRDKQNQK